MVEQNSSSLTPAISVLVPIYNTERYLAQALDSLVAQTFSNFEVICINDGSTDGSREIIQRYLDSDERFGVIDKVNSGYGASMNLGIDKARGEYLAILEPDDFFEPNALQLLHNAALEFNLDVVKANYWFYWSQPTEQNKLIEVCDSRLIGKIIDPRTEPSVLTCIPSIWSALYRKTALTNSSIRFSETPGASFQDLGFQFKVWASVNRVMLLDTPILHYRQDNEASSVNNPDKAFCVCTEFESIKDHISSSPQKELLSKSLFRLRYDSYMWNYARLNESLRRSFLPRMIDDFRQEISAGHYDESLFGAWQNANLKHLLKSPEKFEKQFPISPTKFKKTWYYLRIGGPKALFSALSR